MRILISNPDTLGDLILRQPLLAALQSAGHELMLIVRPAVESMARQIAPGAAVVTLPAEPYALSVAGPWEPFEDVFAASRAFAPAALVIAPFRWTLFEEKLAARLPEVPTVGMSGALYRGDPYAGAAPASHLALDQIAHVTEDDRETAKNAALAAVLLGRPVEATDPSIAAPEAGLHAARELLAEAGWEPGGYWVACVGGTAHVAIKTWPAERWAAALSHWVTRHGRRFAFVGLADESPAVEAVRQAMGDHAAATVNLAREGVSLAALQGVIALSDGYVGHDTGPLHLAAALRKPVIGVYGQGTWPRFLPAVEPSIAVCVGVPCAGCGWVCTFDQSYCIKSVPIEAVTSAIDDIEAGRARGREMRIVEMPAPLLARLTRESSQVAEARLREAAETRKQLAIAQAQLHELQAAEAERAHAEHAASVEESVIEPAGPSAVEEAQRDVVVAEPLGESSSTPEQLGPLVETAPPATSVAPDDEPSRIDLQDQVESNGHAVEVASVAGDDTGGQAACGTLTEAAMNGHVDAEGETPIEAPPFASVDPVVLAEMVAQQAAPLREMVTALEARLATLQDELDRRAPVRPPVPPKVRRPLRALLIDMAIGRQQVPPRAGRSLVPVSVIVPTTGDLPAVRASVESALAQDYPNLEVIVVDDLRDPLVTDYIASLGARVRAINLRGAGTFDLIHQGFKQSYGQVLGYLRPGATYVEGTLSRVGTLFGRRRFLKAAYLESVLADGAWRHNAGPGRQVDLIDFLDDEPIRYESLFLGRSTYLMLGGFNPSRGAAADWDLATRTARMFGLHWARSSGAVVPAASPDALDPTRDVDLNAARAAFDASFGRAGRARCAVLHWIHGATNAVNVHVGAARYTFPRPARTLPQLPHQPGSPPACPLAGGAADRLLFSDLTDAGTVRNFYYSSSGQLAVAQDHEAMVGDAPPAAPVPSAYAGNAPKWTWITTKSPPIGDGEASAGLPAIETLALATASLQTARSAASLIDLSCEQGLVLDAFGRVDGRVSLGLTNDPAAVDALRARGHDVMLADAFDAPLIVPDGRTFDLVVVGRAMQRTNAPLAMLRRAMQMMNPGGALLITADNLASLVLDLYGPTWVGWAGHRSLVSPAAVERLASAAGLRVRAMRTQTYAARAAQSVARNRTGLVPRAADLSPDDLQAGQRIAGWSKLLFNWRGRGDTIHAVLSEG